MMHSSSLAKDLFEKDRETTSRVFDIIGNRQKNISTQLERNDLTPAQRDKLNEDDNELVRVAVAKDTESKKFRLNAMKITQLASLGIQLGAFILPPLLANSEQIADGAKNVMKFITKMLQAVRGGTHSRLLAGASHRPRIALRLFFVV